MTEASEIVSASLASLSIGEADCKQGGPVRISVLDCDFMVEARSTASKSPQGLINLIKKAAKDTKGPAAVVWFSRPEFGEDDNSGDDVVKAKWGVTEAYVANYIATMSRARVTLESAYTAAVEAANRPRIASDENGGAA